MNHQYPICLCIETLRRDEKVILYDKLLPIEGAESAALQQLLADDYASESLNYPGTAPAFDGKAALWAAEYFYLACQFMLHRELDKKDLQKVLLPYKGRKDAAAMLSADLCLRFLPDLIRQCRAFDPEDIMIPMLEATLHHWHYSGIGYDLAVEKLAALPADDCLFRSYVDRIIERKALSWVAIPQWKTAVKAALGNYSSTFWPTLT